MPIIIRAAERGDQDLVVDFNARLAEESEGKALERRLLNPGVAAVLADPHKGRYFLACTGERVVGQTMITYEWSDWRNGWFWWIQSVYVLAEFRGQGVFRRLFEHIHALATADPAVIGLRLYVDQENHRAQETYRKLGLEETNYYVLERYPLSPSISK